MYVQENILPYPIKFYTCMRVASVTFSMSAPVVAGHENWIERQIIGLPLSSPTSMGNAGFLTALF